MAPFSPKVERCKVQFFFRAFMVYVSMANCVGSVISEPASTNFPLITMRCGLKS